MSTRQTLVALALSWVACTSSSTDRPAPADPPDAGLEAAAPVGVGLAAACVSDADCTNGLHCYTSMSNDWGGGYGPAHGYCSRECTDDESVCAQDDPTAVCALLSGRGFCVAGCTYGPDPHTNFDPHKCHARRDLACQPIVKITAAGEQVLQGCWPVCNSDADCEGGRVCHQIVTMCTDKPRVGKELGEKCVFNNTNSQCKGLCKPMVRDDPKNPFTWTCTQSCTTGVTPSCGWGGPGTGPADAYCLNTYSVIRDAGGPSSGDGGLCTQLCDCNVDCRNPDLVCRPFSGTNAALGDVVGRKGSCGDPLLPDGTPAPTLACP